MKNKLPLLFFITLVIFWSCTQKPGGNQGAETAPSIPDVISLPDLAIKSLAQNPGDSSNTSNISILEGYDSAVQSGSGGGTLYNLTSTCCPCKLCCVCKLAVLSTKTITGLDLVSLSDERKIKPLIAQDLDHLQVFNLGEIDDGDYYLSIKGNFSGGAIKCYFRALHDTLTLQAHP